MNIKFIAMGVLSATLISSAVFADDMQQNSQAGTQSPAMAMPSSGDTSNTNTMGQAGTQTSAQSGNATAPTATPGSPANTSNTMNMGNGGTGSSTTQQQSGSSY